MILAECFLVAIHVFYYSIIACSIGRSHLHGFTFLELGNISSLSTSHDRFKGLESHVITSNKISQTVLTSKLSQSR